MKILYLLLLFPIVASAKTFEKYATLSSLPNVPGEVSTTGTDLSPYLGNLYNLGVTAAAGLAVIMVIWGGVEYITSVAGEGKSGGKERITSAILGLLLALGSYIILKTINEDLLSLSFDLKDASELGVNLKVTNPTNYQMTGTQYLSTDGQDILVNNVSLGIQPTTINSVMTGDGRYLAATNNGYVFTTNNPSIDTDGVGVPPFYDPDRQNATSYTINGRYLNANTTAFVAVPNDSPIKLDGSWRATITNNTTGKQITNVLVGDHQRTAPSNPYGEMSLAAAKAIGVWKDGMGNTANPHNVTIEYYKVK